jgi:PhnB protein
VYDPARGYPSVVPYILYRDPAAAIDWLVDVLGLEQALRMAMPDGTVGHAELTLGNQVVMIGLAGGERFGTVSSITLVFVEDVDATCERTSAAGGSVIGEPVDQPWGLRQAVIADPEGQRWEVTKHLRDVTPGAWGADIVGRLPGAGG